MKTPVSRRELVVGLASLPLVAAAPGLVFGQGKVPKAEVNYQDSPQSGKQCSGCLHFAPPNACKLVQGEISPKGWCALYTVKAQ